MRSFMAVTEAGWLLRLGWSLPSCSRVSIAEVFPLWGGVTTIIACGLRVEVSPVIYGRTYLFSSSRFPFDRSGVKSGSA
ncbi:hypothetical protein Bca4012_010689 [Brassica carinata]